MDSLRIVLIEPFYSGSHKQWADGFKNHSIHNVELLTLPGRHWKWRMHGAAVTLAEDYLQLGFKPDLILATSMLDLTTFLSLSRSTSHDVPVALYMHENQITYPWSPQDRDVKHKRDNHYGFINYTSALAADHVIFNSQYHFNSFLDALPGFLSQFPDKQGKGNIERIKKRSGVLPIGIDFKSLAQFKIESDSGEIPIILWNHRWEFDKSPEQFFNALFELDSKGVEFKLVVLGEQNEMQPEIFEKAKSILNQKILHFGYADSFDEYAQWLWKSDILPVTSIHDFFGISVVEAIHCGCYPILPNRLAYPEHVPEQYLYKEGQLLDVLIDVIEHKKYHHTADAEQNTEKYNWEVLIREYDEQMYKVANIKHSL